MDVGGRAKQDARVEDRRFGARSDPSKAKASGMYATQPIPLGAPFLNPAFAGFRPLILHIIHHDSCHDMVLSDIVKPLLSIKLG